MKKTIIILMAMLLVCAFPALATVTYTLTAPANLYATTATSMTFEWNATSDNTSQTGMTSWVYLSEANNDTAIENTSVTIVNTTWYNTTTISGLDIGFYQWHLVTNDTDGNTTSASRWFEIRNSTEDVFFIWENDTGFEAMRLNRDTGDLIVPGDFNVTGDVVISSDVDVSGNLSLATGYSVLADNSFELAYIRSPANKTQTVVTDGKWVNITFDKKVDPFKVGFSHTYNDATNTTFTVTNAGYYLVNYRMSFEDSLANPTTFIGSRLAYVNDTIVKGSYTEVEAFRQNTIYYNKAGFLTQFEAGDQFNVQFTANATTVSLIAHTTHSTAGSACQISINREG